MKVWERSEFGMACVQCRTPRVKALQDPVNFQLICSS